MYKLSELADHVGGTLKGDPDLEVQGFCSLDSPVAGAISFLEKSKDSSKITPDAPAAIITTEALSEYHDNVIISPTPKLSFVDVMEKFLGERSEVAGIHPSAVVDPSAKVADSANICPNAVIGRGAVVGEGSIIGANSTIGENSTVGANCTIYSNVAVYHDVEIGDRVIIHGGTVIGSDGFGFVPTKEGHRKFPQVGKVLIEDDVEIGANCCVDRAALDITIVHNGSKLDNHVQIAHGVKVGSHTVMAAQSGIAGGTEIGKWCVVGGQAGFIGHISVGDQSIIAAKSAVFSDLPYKSKVSGYPAKPHGQSLKVLALTFRLPELVDKIKSLEIELDLMRGEIKRLSRENREEDTHPPAGLA